jgi:hypothetical protein
MPPLGHFYMNKYVVKRQSVLRHGPNFPFVSYKMLSRQNLSYGTYSFSLELCMITHPPSKICVWIPSYKDSRISQCVAICCARHYNPPFSCNLFAKPFQENGAPCIFDFEDSSTCIFLMDSSPFSKHALQASLLSQVLSFKLEHLRKSLS